MSILNKFVFAALCAMLFVLVGCDAKRVEVYIHQDTGCKSDTDCDASYDPATYAWCEVGANNGTCHYETYVTQPSCYSDWDCDDGDASSTDTCDTNGCTHVIHSGSGAVNGAEAIITLQNYCSSTPGALMRTAYTTGAAANLGCFDLDVLSNRRVWVDGMRITMGSHVLNSITNVRLYIDGVIAGEPLATPSLNEGGIATWDFTGLNRSVDDGGATICLMADILPYTNYNVVGWLITPTLSRVEMSDDNLNPINVILGENDGVIAGDSITVARASIGLLSLNTAPVTQQPSTETEILKLQIWSSSNEGYQATLQQMTLDIFGSSYALGQNRVLRVYKGSSTAPSITMTVNSATNLQVTINTSLLGPIPSGSGVVLRVTLDTTGIPAGTQFLQTMINEYRWSDGILSTPVRDNECNGFGIIGFGPAITFN
ncbi:MAG: hypothetical protein U0487_03925 [Patescibacteria group bacterium]